MAVGWFEHVSRYKETRISSTGKAMAKPLLNTIIQIFCMCEIISQTYIFKQNVLMTFLFICFYIKIQTMPAVVRKCKQTHSVASTHHRNEVHQVLVQEIVHRRWWYTSIYSPFLTYLISCHSPCLRMRLKPVGPVWWKKKLSRLRRASIPCSSFMFIHRHSNTPLSWFVISCSSFPCFVHKWWCEQCKSSHSWFWQVVILWCKYHVKKKSFCRHTILS